MINKAHPNTCPKCGATIPADAPQGLCPKCVLLGAATPTESGLPPTATAEIPSLERVAAAFPQLEILELLGRGGMGFVFKARQPHLDRFVALKLLPEKLARDPHFAERFSREARMLARLDHPGIVSIFDFGQSGGFCFLLMEYVDGVNLRQAMQAGKFSPSAALAVVPKICEALQYAHEQGVLHRDIKPANILLDGKGRVKIADFGIAKLIGDEKPDFNLTATGATVGTPQYMAPEQLEQPGTVDHRADIYSLGVVFYEMLTGELPIGRFAPPSQRTPLDPRVDEVVMRALEKEREKRYQSADEVKTNVEHLTEAGAGSPKGAPAQSVPGLPQGSRRTMVIPPGAILPDQSTAPSSWSKLAVVGAILTGVSLPVPLLLLAATMLQVGGIGVGEAGLMLASVGLFGVAGTILGWMGLSNIRASGGTMRGLPLAVFAALAWPLLLLLLVTVLLPSWILVRTSTAGASEPLWHLLVLLIPAGALTFSLWATYAAAQWGGNKPASQSRGISKWVFLALLIGGGAMTLRPRLQEPAQPPGTANTLAPLPEGEVELVALSRDPSDGVWWRPDGTPANDDAFEKANSKVSSQVGPGERAVLFIFRSRELERRNSSRTYEIAGARNWAGGGPPRQNGRPVTGGSFVVATFPESLSATTVRVGVAIDAWETVASDSGTASQSLDFSRHGQARKVAFYGATEDRSGATILTLTQDLPEEDVRILAVDDRGREHASTTRYTTGERHKFTLPNLDPTRVREYRLQVRPYRWAEFKNVQLTPASSVSVRAPLGGPATTTNDAPWIQFTFTAVELREVEGKRWLAIDYLDKVHGDCLKSFPWEANIPGHRLETRTSEFAVDVTDPVAARHQRIEYLLPDSIRREQLEQLRSKVEKALKQKTIRLELGEQKTLFEFGSSSEAALKAWIKVIPPLKKSP